MPPLDDAAKAKLRRQALDSLTSELTAWRQAPRLRPAQDRPTIVQALSRWQKDSDLAGIRDKAALAKLPADEQKAFYPVVDRRGGLVEEGGGEAEIVTSKRAAICGSRETDCRASRTRE